MDHLKDKEVSLAGYVFIKFGYNLEWQKSWILLENRTLYYTDKVYSIETLTTVTMTLHNTRVLHRLEKYMNIQDYLEKSLKIELALKST